MVKQKDGKKSTPRPKVSLGKRLAGGVQAIQLSRKEAKMKEVNPLPKGIKGPTKSSIPSRIKQAIQLSKKEAAIGKVLQPKITPIGKKSIPGTKLGSLGKLGLGLAGGVVGDLVKDALKQNRRPGQEQMWEVVDTVGDMAQFGLGFINPILGAVSQPLLEVIAQSAAEGARQGQTPGAMGLPKDDADFLEYVVKNNIELPASFEEQDKMKKEFLAKANPVSSEIAPSCQPVYESEEIAAPAFRGKLPVVQGAM